MSLEKRILYKNLVVKALQTIEDNIPNEYSANDLTIEFESSHWHFQRLFKSVVGVPLSQFLRRRRLTEATRLLRSTDQKIVDVSLNTGFSSHEAFSRAFKTEFGLGPKEYRNNPETVITHLVHQITPEKLDFFWEDVQREPTIVQRNPIDLVGICVDYKSHFLEGTDCAVKVVRQWKSFLKSYSYLRKDPADSLYGVALSPESDLLNHSLTYLSSVELPMHTEVPSELHHCRLPGGTYARFENRGADQKRTLLIDYIYGIWLPSSSYTRAEGFDFEEFDQRYRLGDDSSISHFYVPVRKNEV